MQNVLSRRHFLELSALGAGACLMPGWAFGADSESAVAGAPVAKSADPHFHLHLNFRGGMDGSYLFDARPLEMTKNGKMQNYLGKEPLSWQGTNGVSTWATELTKPLEMYRSDFSILNGVVMAAAFDGHEQNINTLFTGNPFGGESYVPHMNQIGKFTATPLDALANQQLDATVSNHGSVVPFDKPAFDSLRSRLTVGQELSAKSPLIQFIRFRMAALAQGNGSFSAGSAALLKAHGLSEGLGERLRGVPASAPVSSSSTIEGASDLELVLQFFKHGMARSAVMTAPFRGFDVHFKDEAKKQPDLFKQVVDLLAMVFKTLKETPYDEKRSFFDVTTLLVGTEFGRTMRSSSSSPVDDTGTDHNPLANSILIAGKGIRGGLVIGGTDYQSSAETLSGAHVSFDPTAIKLMGRPFDFATSLARADKPAVYKAGDYLTIHSVVNTLYTLFGVPTKYHRLTERSGPAAPVIQGILA